MGRSKRFRVEYVTNEGSRRLGKNAPLEMARNSQKVSSEKNHKMEFTQDFKKRGGS